MTLKVILIVVVGIQFLVNMYLISIIESMENENEQYFKKLRRDYDVKMDELKKDIELRDEIIEGKMYNRMRGSKHGKS